MNLKIVTEIGKCSSNRTGIQIMESSKNLENHFSPHETSKLFNDVVCVTYMQEKNGLRIQQGNERLIKEYS